LLRQCGIPHSGALIAETFVVPIYLMWSCRAGGALLGVTLLFDLASLRSVQRWSGVVNTSTPTQL
jgi:hypothetical protein